MSAQPLLDVTRTELEGVVILKPRRFGDGRGWFTESFNTARMREAGIDLDFIQDNQSFSADKGTVRGLHYQTPPAAQDKLVRVLAGAILDVAVDLRRASPTYGRHVSVELSAENGLQLLVPKGFAHGFSTLTPDTMVFYKVTAPYAPDCDKGIAFDDPDLKIDWGLGGETPILSDKDGRQPSFASVESPF
ncbi:dTDP-4-dehydrorhamnose 3,5-epimerase [Fulvimarina sp. 2208YS6-2-32]|uniref:dTDP-4-dehydrorhamnose 3,5-epimerase n=1 Tax=Fulvimarina uroteuthidis TaxID=3098149 RepID=A0ABU5I3Y2_9HYPH|nr:dTDP-4-dehydrorhamnose 3,5-epimerase [Fulvimarina sp. 2208YS6-2-32]MDY8108876.1 dTDP-4-dehydrorhamnose 3,5-epimerase [Fulvimarina sp. 2208YS6-2-32]